MTRLFTIFFACVLAGFLLGQLLRSPPDATQLPSLTESQQALLFGGGMGSLGCIPHKLDCDDEGGCTDFHCENVGQVCQIDYFAAAYPERCAESSGATPCTYALPEQATCVWQIECECRLPMGADIPVCEPNLIVAQWIEHCETIYTDITAPCNFIYCGSQEGPS